MKKKRITGKRVGKESDRDLRNKITKKKVAKKGAPLPEITQDHRQEGFNWYPGHMEKALKQIKDNFKLVDIILEVRDARAPLASGNKVLEEFFHQKNRLILLNKANLADPQKLILWEKWFKDQSMPYLFLNCFEKGSLKKVMTMAQQIVDGKKTLANPETFKKSRKLKLMVLGIPNTGKSTIINQIASRAATKTGDRPGHTRAQQWINVDDEIFLLDTPGIIPPDLENEEHRLWLCALHAVPDNVLGEEVPARFLLKYLLDIQSPQLLERYKFKSFDLGIEEALEKIAILRGCLRQKGAPDLDRVYKLILADFRAGELGKCCFEQPPTP